MGVVLKSVQKTKNISLPNFEGSKVTVLTERNIQMQRDLAEQTKGLTNEFDALIKLIVISITEWNFTDEEGKIVEINEKNVGMFWEKDLEVLAEAITNKTMKELQEIGANWIDKKKA